VVYIVKNSNAVKLGSEVKRRGAVSDTVRELPCTPVYLFVSEWTSLILRNNSIEYMYKCIHVNLRNIHCAASQSVRLFLLLVDSWEDALSLPEYFLLLTISQLSDHKVSGFLSNLCRTSKSAIDTIILVALQIAANLTSRVLSSCTRHPDTVFGRENLTCDRVQRSTINMQLFTLS